MEKNPLNKGEVTDQHIGLMKDVYEKAGVSLQKHADTFEKAGVTTGTGIVAVDILEPAMTQIPIRTPFRNLLTRKSRPNPGTKAEWRVINSMIGSGFDSMGWVPEGQRAGVKSISRVTASASYRVLGEEGRLTEEAQDAAKGLLDDLLAYDTLMTLRKLMLKEENSLLFGNLSNKLGTPTGLIAAATAASATLPANTYYFVVVALTAEGKLNVVSNASGAPVSIPTSQTVSGADGNSYTINGGSSNKSAIGSQVITLGQALDLSVPYIRGAVAYAWFVGTANSAASLYLQAVTTINCIRFSAPIVTTGTQTADQVTQDSSFNDGTGAGANQVTAYDGMMSLALNPANNAFYQALATGAGGVGTSLTATGAGGIEEVDLMMVRMWETAQLSVDNIWVSARTARAMYKSCINSSSGPLLKENRDVNDNKGITLTGGGKMAWYTNPVSPLGGNNIPVQVHPCVPDGVILGYSSQLPDVYMSAETPAVAEILTRRDYTSRQWPQKTRAYEYGCYVDQVLAGYAPFAMGVIANVQV